MPADIELYFDFSSPYGYLAASRAAMVEQATGRTVRFTPYLLGAVFKTSGRQPLASHPLVWDYARNDVARTARRQGLTLRMPDPFPVVTASACRAFYFVRERDGDDAARALALRLYQAYFADGRNISRAEVVVDVVGGDAEQIRAALHDEEGKAALRRVTDQAIERGVFGSPFFLVDGEAFWGNDRVEDVTRWANGPW